MLDDPDLSVHLRSNPGQDFSKAYSGPIMYQKISELKHLHMVIAKLLL